MRSKFPAVVDDFLHELSAPVAALLKLIIGGGPLVSFHNPLFEVAEALLIIRDVVEQKTHVGVPDNGTDVNNEPAFLCVVKVDHSHLVAIKQLLKEVVTSMGIVVNNTVGIIFNWDSQGGETFLPAARLSIPAWKGRVLLRVQLCVLDRLRAVST